MPNDNSGNVATGQLYSSTEIFRISYAFFSMEIEANTAGVVGAKKIVRIFFSLMEISVLLFFPSLDGRSAILLISAAHA